MKTYRITVDGTEYDVSVEEITAGAAAGREEVISMPQIADHDRGAAGRSLQKSGTGNEIKAPVPGTVLSVEVAAGQQVSAGQVLLIIEAMKMENEILAPSAGKVISVAAVKGTAVDAGDVLVTLS